MKKRNILIKYVPQILILVDEASDFVYVVQGSNPG